MKEKEKENIPIPIAIPSPDFTKLIEYVKYIVEVVDKEETPPKDCESYVWEEVAKAIYGKEFWKWWNNKLG